MGAAQARADGQLQLGLPCLLAARALVMGHGKRHRVWKREEVHQRHPYWRLGVPIIHSLRDQTPPLCDAWSYMFDHV